MAAHRQRHIRSSRRGDEEPSQEAPPIPGRGRAAVGLIVVVGVALLARLPPYLNSGAVNSDAAVVGLQAMALLKRGELDLHLWGSGYQTVVDVLFVAGVFKVFGPSPWASQIAERRRGSVGP